MDTLPGRSWPPWADCRTVQFRHHRLPGQRPDRRLPRVTVMRAVQITRFGGPEVMDIVDVPDPTPGEGQTLYEVSSAGVNFADTHHSLSREVGEPRAEILSGVAALPTTAGSRVDVSGHC